MQVLQPPRWSGRLEHKPPSKAIHDGRCDCNGAATSVAEIPMDEASSASFCPHGTCSHLPFPLEEIERRIGYRFIDRTLLAQALVHASVANTRVASNERLEFLGDAILGAIVCEHLYRRFPEELEGGLTKVKSNAVSRRVCADVSMEYGLADAVQLGKGMGDRSQLPVSLLAALFESVVGAMYLDGGIEPARAFVLGALSERIEQSARLGHQQNFKSVLQQTLQQQNLGAVSYVILNERGPDHAKEFEICVDLSGTRYPGCWGLSKKSAEQMAALEALIALGIVERAENGEVRVLPAA